MLGFRNLKPSMWSWGVNKGDKFLMKLLGLPTAIGQPESHWLSPTSLIVAYACRPLFLCAYLPRCTNYSSTKGLLSEPTGFPLISSTWTILRNLCRSRRGMQDAAANLSDDSIPSTPESTSESLPLFFSQSSSSSTSNTRQLIPDSSTFLYYLTSFSIEGRLLFIW